MSAVFFFGSRAFASSSAVAGVVASVAARRPGAVFVSCCAPGACSFAVSALVAAGFGPCLSLFAAGSSSGAGFPSSSGFAGVAAAARSGSVVRWLAGGALSSPLVSRLLARSSAAVAAAAAAGPGGVAVGFLASPGSAGSLRESARALASGLSVVVCCSFAGAPAAVRGASWVAVRRVGCLLPFASVWRLVAAC